MYRDCRTGLPQLRRPEAVVFDMDGVLFDTEPLYREAASITGADFGYVLPISLADRVIGLSWPRTRLLLVDAFGPSFPLEEFIAAWLRRFDELTATRLQTKPGVRELIHALDQLAVPKAIATGSLSANAQRHLAAHALSGSFAAIVAHEDCAAGKPAPDPFLKAAELLGIAPGLCIAIEDSYNGVRSAAAAGMMTIMVPDLVPPNEEMRALCVHVAKDLHEVEELIRAAIQAQGITDLL
jgi:HAD superfamily hydrolase (TIGR01509 family)